MRIKYISLYLIISIFVQAIAAAWGDQSVFESSNSYSSNTYHDYSSGYSNSQTAIASASASSSSSNATNAAAISNIKQQDKRFVRAAAGEVWTDDTLNEWPENDYRLFIGDLGIEATEALLAKEFQCYKSFAKVKVNPAIQL
jgi:cytoskeletal protein RodZ